MHRITIFHYHLQTGGITQVIRDSVYSLLQTSPEQFEITIVSGRREHSDEFIRQLKSLFPSTAHTGRITGDVCGIIEYTDAMDTIPDSGQIRAELLRRYGGTTWWVHNYHIGKNPQFTAALLDIINDEPEQKIVLHIHDFPESGRFANLKKLRSYIQRPLYPISPQIRYIVINQRDHEILTDAGLPEEMVFTLNNPVRTENTGFIDIWQVHDKINRWARETQPRWISGGKLILYPIRTIRRKNVLEAALLTGLMDTPSNLLVTLPGSSSQEKAYSDLIAKAYGEKLVPGAWSVGTNLDEFQTSFTELTRSADLILSSSVQEGFGYLFINSLLWSVPLIARDLDILGGMKPLFSPRSSHFYDRLTVPLSGTDRTELEKSFSEMTTSSEDLLPPDLLSNLRLEVSRLLGSDYIDFSFLTAELQYRHLRNAATSASYRKILRTLNSELLEAADGMLYQTKMNTPEQTAIRFGPRAHTQRCLEILDSFEKSSATAMFKKDVEVEQRIESGVLRAFSHAGYFRPLFHTFRGPNFT